MESRVGRSGLRHDSAARTGILKTPSLWMPMLIALSLPACTAEQAYGTAQAWQRNRCTNLPDKAEFDRCMSKTNTTYESYKRQTEREQK